MLKLSASICAGVMLFSGVATAQNVVSTDRYTLLELKANDYERDPLSVPVQMSFPPTVGTVGEAIQYALKHSGWKFVAFPENKALNITLSRPLPKIHRKLGMMPLRDLLQVLVGDTYTPVEDPIRRLYSFDLKDGYRGIVRHES
ncbi:PFGI-1 class ICE element type IV pilus protein PilL2 [Haliea sp.]|jgi:conjugative transfer region protein (TIGR03748 family)|uniref:PFGI-1 class ICE element type IV pilus protein PilL2 n=1 Tax=Haliea sp. TaxID=1932666 RepID=UPI002580EFB4|nr:hypothetical protein [Haliea sp.]|tara:strand:+ start:20901 stop:21332 length:432 start_codon:yes stop_codon:yes gene_type:complete